MNYSFFQQYCPTYKSIQISKNSQGSMMKILSFIFKKYFLLSEIKKKIKNIRLEYKTHDYSKCQEGIDYFFEPAQKEVGWYLRSQGNAERGDRVILLKEGRLQQYQIEQIDRYSDRPDLFVSLLKEIKEDEYKDR
jgi:hypothetical protein